LSINRVVISGPSLTEQELSNLRLIRFFAGRM